MKDHSMVKNILKIEPSTLARAGLVQIEVRNDCNPNDLFELIQNVKHSEDAHTWQNLKIDRPEDSLVVLESFESAKRPTKIFFYYGTRIGSQASVLVGAATVAERLSSQFPFAGYPVIARCVINEEFRNFRLYFPILKHRFDYCISHFGKELKAIHMGTQNKRVLKSIKSSFFGLNFCYVGDELLKLRFSQERVHDFLWFSPSLKQVINDFSIRNRNRLHFETVEKLLFRMVTNDFLPHDFYLLSEGFARVPDLLAEQNSSSQIVNEVMTLLNSIPVMKEQPQEIISIGTMRGRRAG